MRLLDGVESGALNHAFVGRPALVSRADLGARARARADVKA